MTCGNQSTLAQDIKNRIDLLYLPSRCMFVLHSTIDVCLLLWATFLCVFW